METFKESSIVEGDESAQNMPVWCITVKPVEIRFVGKVLPKVRTKSRRSKQPQLLLNRIQVQKNDQHLETLGLEAPWLWCLFIIKNLLAKQQSKMQNRRDCLPTQKPKQEVCMQASHLQFWLSNRKRLLKEGGAGRKYYSNIILLH